MDIRPYGALAVGSFVGRLPGPNLRDPTTEMTNERRQNVSNQTTPRGLSAVQDHRDGLDALANRDIPSAWIAKTLLGIADARLSDEGGIPNSGRSSGGDGP